MFLKKKNIKSAFNDYQQTIQNIHSFLNETQDTEEKIHILTVVSEMIKNDIKYSWLSDIIYKEKAKEIRGFFLNFDYKDETGKIINTLTDEKKTINLINDLVITIPYNHSRFIRGVNRLSKNKFINYTDNHLGYYLKGLDVSYVYNGIHSVTGGILNKKGTIELKVLDITKLYNHIYFDGYDVYSIHTKEKVYELCDFRLAILFEVSKLKEQLTKGEHYEHLL